MSKLTYITGPISPTPNLPGQEYAIQARVANITCALELIPAISSIQYHFQLNNVVAASVISHLNLDMLRACHVVYLLRDWQVSPQVFAELEVASYEGIPVTDSFEVVKTYIQTNKWPTELVEHVLTIIPHPETQELTRVTYYTLAKPTPKTKRKSK